jgi:CRISPR/Cas system endoribonuclease Cas6 (RAMP superfamily)
MEESDSNVCIEEEAQWFNNVAYACTNTMRPPRKYTYKYQKTFQDNLPIRFNVIYSKYRDEAFQLKIIYKQL